MTREELIKAIDCGNMFATRDTLADAFEYVDNVANAMGKADKAAMLVAVAVLCNSIRDQLRAAS